MSNRVQKWEEDHPAFAGAESARHLMGKLQSYCQVVKKEEATEFMNFTQIMEKLATTDGTVYEVLAEIKRRGVEESEEPIENPYEPKMQNRGIPVDKELKQASKTKPILPFVTREEDKQDKRDATNPYVTEHNELLKRAGREIDQVIEPRYTDQDEQDRLPKIPLGAETLATDLERAIARLSHQDNYQTVKLVTERLEAISKERPPIKRVEAKKEIQTGELTAMDELTLAAEMALNSMGRQTELTAQVEAYWEASFTYSAGTMIAELLPDFRTINKNGFYLDISLKEKLIKALNSGKILLKDSHSRSIKDVVGVVKRAILKGEKINIECDITDSKIQKVLEKYPDQLGVSIGGSGIGFCQKCGKQLLGMSKCPEHPDSPTVVKQFDLKEVSICDDPAWSTSKIISIE